MDPVERRRLLGDSFRIQRGRWFSMMRNDALERMATDRDMPRCELVIVLLLSAYADDQGIVVGTLDDIATRIGYGRSMTAEALKALCARGELEKVKRAVYRIPARVCEPSDPHLRSYTAAPA